MKLLLRERMEEAGVTAAQVAEALQVTPGTVSNWLTGQRKRGDHLVPVRPDLDSLEALCLFFGCGPEGLLEVEATATPSGKTAATIGPARGPGRPRKQAAP